MSLETLIGADASELTAAIRNALGDPAFDVDLAFANGGVRLFDGTQIAGYEKLVEDSKGRQVLFRADVRYGYLAYRDVRDLIEAEIAAGRGNFRHVVGCIQSHMTSGLFAKRKMAGMQVMDVNGTKLIAQPFMGGTIPMARELCIPFTDLMINELLAAHLRPDTDAVFEIGCGPGLNLVQLAERNPYPGVTFFGGEIALNGRASLQHLARLAGLNNVQAIPFDMRTPDYAFLKGKRRVLIFSHFVLVYANPFPTDFFGKLHAVADHIDLVLLEPISYELNPDKALFTRQRAESYGICTDLWAHIQAEAPRFEVVKTAPDILGKSPYNSVSLVHLTKSRARD